MPVDHARQVQRARALRSDATEAERRLWCALSDVRPRFTRQLPIGPYIADFACRRARVAVELDGGQHAASAGDRRRDAALEEDGWRVIRLWNTDVSENLAGSVERIVAEVDARLPAGERCCFVTRRVRGERRGRSDEG